MPSDDEDEVFFLRSGVGNAPGAHALLEKKVCVGDITLHRNMTIDDASLMLLPFLDRPVVVESPRGQAVGVLVGLDVHSNGSIGSLIVHEFRGTWILVKMKTWSAIKNARLST
jgi:hypothetical protein